MDGSFQVGIIPAHRSSQSLVYADLFTETMLLYCGARHPLFGQDRRAGLGRCAPGQFAGLGYHSPNMELSHGAACRARPRVSTRRRSPR
jgi:DNA-binding transcriptional LysR family regulator